jgi:hypothetical protein
VVAEQKRGTGRIYIPDPRDRAYSMASAVRATGAVGSKVWKLAPERLDQGTTSQCVGFSWKQFLTAAPIMHRDRALPAPAEIYKAAQKVDEWPGEAYEGTSVRAGAKVLKSLGLISGYLWAPDLDTMKRFIVQRGPVVVGTDWYQGMYRPRGGFVIPEGTYRGGHAYLVHGWSDTRRAFRVLNSWGESWGERGAAWVDETDMRYLIFQANGECCSAIEVEQ